MYQERLNQVVKYMKKEQLEQLLVSAPASIFYLTGLRIDPQERLLVLFIKDSGQVKIFANEIFGLEEQISLPLCTHNDTDNPVRQLADEISSGPLGIDKFWYSNFLISLWQLRPDIRPVHGSGPLDLARTCKDADEQKKMRRSSQINDQVIARAIESLQLGISERELAEVVKHLFSQKGADDEDVQLVCFGANGADPHHLPDNTTLRAGDGVTIDIFASIDNYWCDMTRTVFYKEVSAEQERVYNLVKLANETAIQLIRPGVPLSELDRTARQVISEGGYGEFFTHRLGHGVGLECHEPPDVSSASQVLASAGMVFSIEPGIYLPGKFGVRIEDLVLVTEKACEVINNYPKELIVVD